MSRVIGTIRLSLPYGLGSVNCYLITADSGHLLIDTGSSNARSRLQEELESAGCRPGRLKLIVITHGDFDHAGNAAFLRGKLGAKIAIHRDDAGMAERGDMFWNRHKGGRLFRMLAPMLFRFGKADRFKPDVFLEDGTGLSEYGFDAHALCIPGHSKGSLGILTAGGDLFCGDLFTNTDKPALNSIMDDPGAAHASVERLNGLHVGTVYPGHGQPFAFEELLRNKHNPLS
jgi:hydroxyacylglutathione hydrolase